LANGIVAELALAALAAIDIERNDGPVALPELIMSEPVSTTSPMNSCPRISPLFIIGIRPSIR
jgi:hypothetical protein